MNRDRYSLYLNAFKKSIKRYVKELDELEHPDIKKIVFYGVKTIKYKPRATNHDEALSDFDIFTTLKSLIASLTPNEFMNLFPVSKVYDGDRFEIKDYFYTIDYINAMNKDEMIGETVTEFLMEYTNRDIDIFNVRNVMCVSDLRQYGGHLDLMEEFMASDGYDTPNTFKNAKGEAMYVKDGKPILVDGIKNNKLKLIK